MQTISPAGSSRDTGVLLWRVTNAWQRRLRATLKPAGLTQAQFYLLLALSRLEGRGPVTQARLAVASGIDPTMVSTVIRELGQRGLLTRRQGQDARTRMIALTAPGREALATALPAVASADSDFFAALKADRDAFAQALGILIGIRPRVTARSRAVPPDEEPTTPR
ncbi:MAG: MarR family winged helix-turn-helix transcriptional regulator [Alphaproteobacteria bacterium]